MGSQIDQGSKARGFISMGAFVTLPRLVTPGSHFIRTIILAHTLSPRNLGIALALTVLISMAELVSDFGLDRYLMSRNPTDDLAALDAAHALQLGRGLILAIVIWLSAPWIAQLLGAADNAPGFRWCAAILLLRDLAHLEIKQLQRDLHYKPDAIASLLARPAALVAVYPAAVLFGDYRAMVASLLTDAVVYVAASHFLAQNRFRVVPTDRRVWREAIRYSLPLTLNGIGVAASSQLDRALVSNWFGVETLALYALVLNLAVVPSSIALGILGLVSVSLLARGGIEVSGDTSRYVTVTSAHAITALAYVFVVSSALDLLVPLVFGPAYRVGPSTVILISWLVSIRIVRGAPTSLLLARSHTRQLMMGNLLCLLGLTLAFGLLPLLPRIDTMIFCVIIGDALSVAFMMWSLRRISRSEELRAERLLILTSAFLLAVPPVLQLLLHDHLAWRIGIGCAGALTVAGFGAISLHRQFIKSGFMTPAAQGS